MSGRVQVLRWDASKDGPLSEHAMKKKLEALGYAVSRWVYCAGTVFDYHTHDVDKIDGVVEGRFELRMLGETVVLEPGDAIVVPRGTSHRAEVIGEEDVVSLDALKR